MACVSRFRRLLYGPAKELSCAVAKKAQHLISVDTPATHRGNAGCTQIREQERRSCRSTCTRLPTPRNPGPPNSRTRRTELTPLAEPRAKPSGANSLAVGIALAIMT